jgi:hypothetical protein
MAEEHQWQKHGSDQIGVLLFKNITRFNGTALAFKISMAKTSLATDFSMILQLNVQAMWV